MKNVHVIPTDKLSKLYKCRFKGHFILNPMTDLEGCFEEGFDPQNISVTNSEEIKEGDWFTDNNNSLKTSYKLSHVQFANPKKIILTTDQDLIKDGIQPIDNQFLEWFVKNPSCEEVEVEKGNMELDDDGEEYGFSDMSLYKIIFPKEEPKQLNPEDFGLPQFGTKEFNDLASQFFGGKPKLKEEPKQETLEEAAEKRYPEDGSFVVMDIDIAEYQQFAFIEGAKWQQEQYTIEEQHVGHTIDELDKEYIKGFNEGSAYQQERMYSEEEVTQLLIKFNQEIQEVEDVREWFQQFKKK